MKRLPDALFQLVKDNPLDKEKDTARVLSGDLKFALRAYRKRAAYHGSRGDWWNIFREIRILLGLNATEACRGMSTREMNWFSEWAFDANLPDDGIAAQRKLAKSKELEPGVSRGNVRFLDALMRIGHYDEVLDVVAGTIQENEEPEHYPNQQRYAARALLALKRPEEAIQILRRVLARHHDNGYLWAQLAIAYQHLEMAIERDHAVLEAAKLGLYNPHYDPSLRDRLLAELNISSKEWAALHAPFALTALDYEIEEAEHKKDPGYGVRISKEKTLHRIGGLTFKMPDCPGCGSKIRQAVVIDIRAHLPLLKVLPDWTLMPLLLCVDCCAFFDRHDYEVDLTKLQVSLVNVCSTGLQYESTRPKKRPFKKRAVELIPEGNDIQIGGRPCWIQEQCRLFCRTCRKEMVYVGSLGNHDGLDPCPEIPGYVYHFACSACKTISTIAQNS